MCKTAVHIDTSVGSRPVEDPQPKFKCCIPVFSFDVFYNNMLSVFLCFIMVVEVKKKIIDF